jgi:hypothetical protein
MDEYIKKKELTAWLKDKQESAEIAQDYTREMVYREVLKKVDE